MEFRVNSRGWCIFCLEEISPPCPSDNHPDKSQTSREQRKSSSSTSSVHSIQHLSRYLKLDLRKLFSGKVVKKELLDKVEKSKLKVELCEECANLTGKLLELCRQLERMEMEVRSYLEAVHGRLVKGDGRGDNKAERFSGLAKGGNKGMARIVQVLRTETILKCARKLRTACPRVKVQKLMMMMAKQEVQVVKTEVANAQSSSVDPSRMKQSLDDLIKKKDDRLLLEQESIPEVELFSDPNMEIGPVHVVKMERFDESKQASNVDPLLDTDNEDSSLSEEDNDDGDGASVDIQRDPEEIFEERQEPLESKKMEQKAAKMMGYTTYRDEGSESDRTECSLCHLKVKDITGHLYTTHFEPLIMKGQRWSKPDPLIEEESSNTPPPTITIESTDDEEEELPNMDQVPPPPPSRKNSSRRKFDKTEPIQVMYRCSVCGSEFPTEFDCRQHHQVHIDDMPIPLRNGHRPTAAVPPLPPPPKDFGKQLRPHLVRGPGEEPSPIWTPSPSPQPMKPLHKRSKTATDNKLSTFVCDICGKEFARKQSVKRHQLTSHMGVRHECPTCHKLFSLRSNLIKHQCRACCGGRRKNKSSPPPVFSCHCSICGKGFLWCEDLPRHMETHHVPDGQHNCDLCGCSFRVKTALWKHRESDHSIVEREDYVITPVEEAMDLTISC